MRLHPITARNPTTCDYCHAPIAKHAMLYFAVREERRGGNQYAIGCSPECASAMEKPQPPEAA